MNLNLFQAAIRKQNPGRPPVWFMRQAGRYHSHYQAMKSRHSFMELCKIPAAACETTLGPVRDFGFDAAILFSDLLFPLEAMGTGLRYDPGPKLDHHLRTLADVERLRGGGELARELEFQAQAMRLIRAELPEDRGLLGFVGGPLTLFFYAVDGSHHGDLDSSRAGLVDGRFQAFNERLEELLARNMALQARAGADTVAMLDTCGGEIDAETFRRQAVPATARVLARFKALCPDVPVTYYSKGTGPEHWATLRELPIDCLGIDWRHDLAQVLRDWSDRFAIQGNIDPEWLFLEPGELERRLREVFGRVKALPERHRRGWIAGLGHGVLQKTPEANVRLWIRLQHEIFGG
jgi:uroporphyrinogen decarboxylase